MMLFAEPLIPGLELREDFVGAAEEDELITRICGLGLEAFQFQGWSGKRLTRSFGWRYDFDDASFTEAEPIPDSLLPLREKAAALAGLKPEDFAHALIIRYDPGAGIGWHRDRPQFDKVVGVSLGAPTVMRFRQRTAAGFRRANAELLPRSAYLLSGQVRSDWEHSIAPHPALRFSITFRSLSERGLRSRSAPPPASGPPSAR
ncbi:MAG TPA: alpha-ketoglutarate-dependent dioxygenase AlkB [Sphingomicrobium sp.]|jgi:alkylated DNA repair dioxygenase AlkB|nr:alpha-ketoglutarate-dependent dioxygenase AlkB [Sphingomicrobium sp.]